MAAPAAALRILIDANARPARREIGKADRTLKQFSAQANKMSDVRLDANGAPLRRELARSQKGLRSFSTASVNSTGKMRASFGLLGRSAVGAGAAIGGAGGLLFGIKSAITASVDLNEQINKTAVVFRGSERSVLAWSKTTARGIGISRRSALEAAGTFGNMLVPMGFARKQAASMSTEMVNLAGDMASFNNASPQEVLEALRAGLAGETEPLRRFGVFLNDARLKHEAMQLGLKNAVGPTGALNANAKAQATYSVILKDTKDAQGDFARTSTSLANQMRILKANVDNTAASLGKAVTPALSKAAQAVNALFAGGRTRPAWMDSVSQFVSQLAGPLLGVVGKALRDSRADLDAWGQAARNVFVGIRAVVEQFVLPVFRRLAPAIAQSLGGVLGVVRGLLNILAGIFTLNFGRIWTGAKQVFGGLGQMIVGNLRAMSAPARQAAAMLAQGIAKVWRGFVDSAVRPIWGAVKAAILSSVGSTTGWVVARWRGFVGTVRGIWNAVKAATSAAWGATKAVILAAVGSTVGWVVAKLRGFAATVRGIWGAIKTAAATGWGAIKAAILAPAGSAAGAVIGKFETFKKTLAGIWGAIKEGAARGWAAIGSAIVNPIKNAVEGVKNFLGKIVGHINKVLDFFSLDKIPGFQTGGKVGGGVEEATRGRTLQLARGGKIRQGKASGDSVPALLERGEYVLNRQAVRKAGAANLDRLNFGEAPRFGMQRGGPAPGSNLLTGANEAIRSIANWAWKKFGATVSSGYTDRVGGSTHHARGGAADLLSGNMVALARGLASAFGPKLAELIHTPLGFGIKNGRRVPPYATADHYDHVHVAALGKAISGGGFLGGIAGKILDFATGLGGDAVKGIAKALSPALKVLPEWFRPIGRALLDKVAGGAKDKIAKASSESAGQVGAGIMPSGPVPPGNVRGWLTKALKITGHFSPGNLAALYRQAMSESTGNPRAINLWDINAKRGIPSKGLLQTVDPTFNAYKLPGMNDIYNPIHNAVAAIRYMMAEYGHIVGTGRGYQLGGLVGLQTGGAPAPKQKPKGKPKRRGKPFDSWALFGSWGRAQTTEVPTSIRNAVEQFSSQAGFAGEMADRAQTLGSPGFTFDEITKKQVWNPGAMVEGKNELDWLKTQLGALGALRNQLVHAYQAAMQRRAMLSKMLEQLQAQLKKLQEERKQLLERIQNQRAALAAAKKGRKVGKKTVVNKAAVAVAQRVLDGSTARLTNVNETIGNMPKAIGDVRKRRDGLAESGAKSLESLGEVQGAYGPRTLLPRLPEIGALGGTIFQVQARIADLSKPAETKQDVSTGVGDDNAAEQQAALLQQLLREANVRTAISERQFATLKALPPFGGSFATGGVVPGPGGAPRMVVAHGGETITPAGQGKITVVVNGDITNVPAGRDPVEVVLNDRRFAVAVERATRPAGRHADRRLPSSRSSF